MTCEANQMNTDLQDQQKILQLIIDSKQLEKYYHTDVLPERVPLRIINNNLINTNIRLVKFGRDVIFIEQDNNEPYLLFSAINIETDSAHVVFEYPPEGIKGLANLTKKNGNWEINKLTLHER
jgi:hypothetical protein